MNKVIVVSNKKKLRQETLGDSGGGPPRFLKLGTRWSEWLASGSGRLTTGERVPVATG
jgi:hypothetical protein